MNQRSLFDHVSFAGETVEPEDVPRLETALGRVYRFLSDGKWRTLREIADACGCSESGASARIRDLRKDHIREMYPSQAVDSRKADKRGLWVYRLRT